MKSVKVKIRNKLGLHARPAMTFAETASRFASVIRVRRTDANKPVDGKSIMQILMLAGTKGTELEISAEGDDEQQAVAALKALVRDRFEEGD